MGPEGQSDDRATLPAQGGDAQRTGSPPCFRVTATSPENTQNIGSILGRLLRPGDLILLRGPLGAGKTCLAQGVVRGFGLRARVTSPSFTLANVYENPETRSCLYHLDLWRIKSAPEALGIGLDEYLEGPGPCIIEWPEIATSVLPNEHLQIRFTVHADARELEICGFGQRHRALLEKLRERLHHKGYKVEEETSAARD